MLETRCPACDQRLKFREDNMGRTIKCPGCSGRVETMDTKVATFDDRPRPGVRVAALGVRSGKGRPRRANANMPRWLHAVLMGLLFGVIWGVMAGIVVGTIQGFRVPLDDSGVSRGTIVGLAVLFTVLGMCIGHGVLGSLMGLGFGLSGHPLVAWGIGLFLPALSVIAIINAGALAEVPPENYAGLGITFVFVWSCVQFIDSNSFR
jgi:hypothetical protein